MAPSIPPKLLPCLLLAAVVVGLAAPPAAAFDARNPASVGVIVMPFEVWDDKDESLGFLLEDFLRANLERRLRRPTHIGQDITPALTGAPRDCLVDEACVRLLGGQFNSSLAALVVVRRNADTITLNVDWYTTGDGKRFAQETTSFQADRQKEMLAAFTMWIDRMFDPSLRVKGEGGAGEGRLLADDDQDARRAEYERGRRKKVSSRRQDFGRSRSSGGFDRDDPTADLRAMTEEEEEYEEEPEDDAAITFERDEDRSGRSAPVQREPPPARRSTPPPRDPDPEPYDDDEEELDLDDEPPPRAPARRDSAPRDEVDLSADDSRGVALAGYTDAQREGYSPREVKRFQRTGLDFPAYHERRWALGMRVHLRVDFAYALGGLTRRYSSLVHYRPGGVKTEEYSWESLGLSFVHPGGRIGVGFSPVDFVEIGADFGVMLARQALRREYIDEDADPRIVSICTEVDCPDEATWKSAATPNWTIDIGARFYLLPLKRAKPYLGVAASFVFMAGYEIEKGDYEYTDRPPAVIFGVTPKGGVVIAITPFLSLNLGVEFTIYAAQGAAKHEADDFFNNTDPAEPWLEEGPKEVPYRAAPWMFRGVVGPMIVF